MSYNLNINCLKFSSLALFLLFFQVLGAQKKNPKEHGIDKFPDLDALVTQRQKLLGQDISVLVWKDTVLYKRELGEFNSKTAVPIGSSSKWLTVAAVLQQVDEGKLSLDDKVGQYLPIFDKYGKSYITLRHCLSHFTGIAAGKSGLFKGGKTGSLEEEVEAFAKNEIQANAGVEFRYSDIGMNIAARVVEVVTKKKFDAIIRQKLFVPLGMRQTSFAQFNGSAIDPSSGAVSSANDYMNFLVMLLNNGKFNGKQVLSEASVKELRRIQTSPELIKFAPKTTMGYNYALGSWALEEKDGQATVLSNPGLSGPWPILDYDRKYVALVFLKSSPAEQKKENYMAIKDAIDEAIR
jgi:CubicO group peptidase (beta-lactamase class C family)